MTSHDSSPNVASSDRRSGSREASLGPVRIIVEAESLVGSLENTSQQGMFVVLDNPLQVEVAVGTGEDERCLSARLTRVAALPGQRSGWGLELISDSSVA